MDRRVTPPTWGLPPPCKQAIGLRDRRDHSRKESFEINAAKTCGECSLLRRGLFVLWGGWGERKGERAGLLLFYWDTQREPLRRRERRMRKRHIFSAAKPREWRLRAAKTCTLAKTVDFLACLFCFPI